VHFFGVLHLQQTELQKVLSRSCPSFVKRTVGGIRLASSAMHYARFVLAVFDWPPSRVAATAHHERSFMKYLSAGEASREGGCP
jgi:hypothetical protein